MRNLAIDYGPAAESALRSPEDLDLAYGGFKVLHGRKAAQPALAPARADFSVGGTYPIAIQRLNGEPNGSLSDSKAFAAFGHPHDFTALVLVTGGRGVHRCKEERIPVSPGNVFVLQGRRSHGFWERSQLQLTHVMFDPVRLQLPVGLLQQISGYRTLFPPAAAYSNYPPSFRDLRLNRHDLGFAEALIGRMEKEIVARSEGHEIVLFTLLIELITFFSRRVEHRESTEARASLRIIQLLERLERDFCEPWTVDEMARTTKLSRGCLIRTFRKATGYTPIDYLIRLRVKAAMTLLQRLDLNVTEVALHSGFSDGNYFARQFRRICGCSASEFRRAAVGRA